MDSAAEPVLFSVTELVEVTKLNPVDFGDVLERLYLRDHLVKFSVGRHGDPHRDLVGAAPAVLIDVERPERGFECVHDLGDLTDDR